MVKHTQIAGELRNQILSGQRKPGDLLPTIQELASSFGTSVFTIHTALSPLVKEGLIECRRRVGTVVRHNPKVLTCAGIYAGGGLLDEWEYAFYRELCRELQRQLGEAQIESKLFADMRSTPEHLKPLPELVTAVETRAIQALFVPLCDWRTIPWLSQLPVSKSFVTSDPVLNPVGCDGDQMMTLALTRLRERGCHTVGLISSVRIPADTVHPYFRIYKKFIDLVSDLGLKTRDGWVVTPEDTIPNLERYGYDSFRRQWSQAKRPEGVFVYPDTTARGAMAAALELGVRVPQDIKMVFHSNSGVDWLCPLAVDWVEVDTAHWAAAMIGQIQQQKSGQEIQSVNLPFRLR